MSPASIPLSLHDDGASEPNFSFVRLKSESIGRLRRELNWTVGKKQADGVMARLGLSCGLSGETCEGWGDLTDKSAGSGQSEYIFESLTSCEANETKRFSIEPSHIPQCWFLAGFLSGFLSRKIGHSIYVLETRCRAKGDPCCRFVGKTKEKWSTEYTTDLNQYTENNMELDFLNSQHQLHLIKERFQNLFEHAAVPLLIVDPTTGLFLEANLAAENLTGYSRQDLGKMTLFDLCPPTDHPILITGIKNWMNDEESTKVDVKLHRKDEAERVVTVSGNDLSYLGKKVVQITLQDVTDLKVAAQKEKDLQIQLLRSERLSGVGRLAAGVAHEIKNPLGAIRNAIYYIRQSLSQHEIIKVDPKVNEIMNLAENEIDGAVAIIENLLDFSQIVQLLPRRTSLNDLLEKIPSFLSIPANIKLVWDLDMTLPSAFVDPDRLKQVFSNILMNAIQAMPQGGTITIRTRYEIESLPDDDKGQERAAILFEDSGIGIPPHYLKKIFEPLFTTKARGTGLGLAISHNIIEKHGGTILATSQMGKGSCFAVRLPLNTMKSSEEKNDVIQ